jgi:hypothetical protein
MNPRDQATSTPATARTARVYGALDLLFASVYAYVGLVLAPSRLAWFTAALCAVVGLLGAAGVALLVGGTGRAARVLGMVACSVLLAFAVAVIALLVGSTAFLFGVYGALGRGIGVLSIVAAALVLEVCGLLPLFQLAFHFRQRRASAP